MRNFSIVAAQLNPHVGNMTANVAQIRAVRKEARQLGADLILFPELFLAGYPAEDLLLKSDFQEACRQWCVELAKDTADGGPALLVGLPWVEEGTLKNACALLSEGKISGLCFKTHLPNYGVFDEKRVFSPGIAEPLLFRGIPLGIPICEDMWSPEVVRVLKEKGAELLLSPHASPYWRNKSQQRLAMARARVWEVDLPCLYLNQWGGQDDLVFDGASFAMNADGSLACQMPQFRSCVQSISCQRLSNKWEISSTNLDLLSEGDEADYRACLLGLRDYVQKNHFRRLILGLSGGIDSALCACLATDALGAEQVAAFMLPYHFTSSASIEDAAECAAALKIKHRVLPIAKGVESVHQTLAPFFGGKCRGVTSENIQSRIRGLILMGIANEENALLLTTGNKSELAVGYATLYGDMNGAYNPIKDLYKTDVYRLAALRNKWKPLEGLGPTSRLIPENIFQKAPSAELRENQKDEDSLPPYSVLDEILQDLIEKNLGASEIIQRGWPAEQVKEIENLLYSAEYKRRQSAPGTKLSEKSFGREWRYPMTHDFRTCA